jgi:hypothetical protein
VGLDVYVGSLTRYLTGDWELVTETAGRELGITVHVERLDEPEDAIRDPDVVREAVLDWRNTLSDALGKPLEWREDDAAPYFTDKPDWGGLVSLHLLAAHVEHPELDLPLEVPEDPFEEPLLQAVIGPDKRGFLKRRRNSDPPRFATLYTPEVWLPVDEDGVWQATFVTGDTVRMASVLALARDLRELANELGAGEDDLRTWSESGGGGEVVGTVETEGGQVLQQLAPGTVLEEGRFGLATVLALAELAVEHRLPMKLDY